ncbi:serine hydrolase domain-containing protein [Herbiconiux sp. UC225_62]|uniref:serine hydrolase domain-containing protein n=1 Tax=Herbiconiux sp. UC225_62 TaxID=3350168 RepID=UPI0036D36909
MTGSRSRRHRGLSAVAAGAAAAAFVALGMTTVAPAAAADEDTHVVAMTPELKVKIQNHIETFQKKYDIAGMSVAVVTPDPSDPSGSTPVTTTISVGVPTFGSSTPVDASTQFEIASETKIFTSDLLAHLVATKAVSLDDPVQKFAPAGITVPVWTDPVTNEKTHITLRDLATHQAGLTDMPWNIGDGCGTDNCDNPRPGYTQTMIWNGLADQELLWKPGTNWLYSNWGFGLLGTILANIVDPSIPVDDPPAYLPALQATFLDALGMSSTALGTGPRIATPYASDNTPTYYWDDTNAMAGEGGIVSDTTDMATWLAAHLGYIKTDAPHGVRTMADTLKPLSTITTVCSEPDTCAPVEGEFHMGLGWQLYSGSSSNMGVDWAFKNGGTAGFSSDTALAPSKGVGVTTMWNQNRVDNAEPGIELLDLILHHRDEPKPDHGGDHDKGDKDKDKLADTGLGATSIAVPGVGAVVLLAAGVVLIVRRRSRAGRAAE